MSRFNSKIDITLLSGVLVLLIFLISSCGQTVKQTADTDETTVVPVKYAECFKIEKQGNKTILTINKDGVDKQHGSEKIILTHNPDAVVNAPHIDIPCQKMICLSSTQLGYFFTLENIDNIVAINSSRYLHHKGMRKKIEKGEVKRIGKEGHFNIEVIASLDPDVIFVSPFKTGGYDALKNLGIPLVPIAAYNEQTPLGRAEWIKVLALFTHQEAKADSIFSALEKNYNHLKSLTENISDRPTVFSGKMRSGSWYVPGGDSFYARYFRDAGADYIIKDSVQGAYPLSFETVYQKANACDYWRILHPEKVDFDMDDLASQDERYRDFKAFKTGNVFFCNMRKVPYHEQVVMKADTLLADYIHYFHPELLPDHKPVFYERLK